MVVLGHAWLCLSMIQLHARVFGGVFGSWGEPGERSGLAVERSGAAGDHAGAAGERSEAAGERSGAAGCAQGPLGNAWELLGSAQEPLCSVQEQATGSCWDTAGMVMLGYDWS